uniref:ATPase dynein-related AAA domain-containing protein n=1 Tax=candidate division WOR-3 bacterium TaxID=2052148 RepID=A0A7C3YTX3_UNCW3
MKSERIIKTLEEKAGLDPKTLIFEPEKAEAFIEEIEKENRNRIAFLPVKPDWNEAKKVFGYYNPLTGLFYPTDGLNVLLNAFCSLMRGEKDKKYFIILDEMNLARVEYYFSDILSLMENMWKIKEGKIQRGEVSQIHPILDACLLSKPNFPQDKVDQKRAEKVCWLVEKKEECSNCAYHPLLTGEKLEVDKKGDIPDEVKECQPIPPKIAYPENLVIIGTVNVDETTFSFAPKVLDRAFQLEFTDVKYKEYLATKNITEENPFYKFVESLQTILKTRNMHFGYRVIDEMLKYLKNIGKREDKDFDFLLKSKVLPKFHGTEEQIGDILIKLLAFCAGKENYEVESKGKDKDQKFKEEILNEKDKEGNWWQFSFDKYKSIFEKYFESAQKLWQMYQNMKATGYCSYF